MIIPWQQLAPETLYNLIKEFVLQEGTDYGIEEVPLSDKIEQVQRQLQNGQAVIVFSELHQTANIQLKR